MKSWGITDSSRIFLPKLTDLFVEVSRWDGAVGVDKKKNGNEKPKV
jgi:hypothetical protein